MAISVTQKYVTGLVHDDICQLSYFHVTLVITWTRHRESGSSENLDMHCYTQV